MPFQIPSANQFLITVLVIIHIVSSTENLNVCNSIVMLLLFSVVLLQSPLLSQLLPTPNHLLPHPRQAQWHCTTYGGGLGGSLGQPTSAVCHLAPAGADEPVALSLADHNQFKHSLPMLPQQQNQPRPLPGGLSSGPPPAAPSWHQGCHPDIQRGHIRSQSSSRYMGRLVCQDGWVDQQPTGGVAPHVVHN